MRIVWRIAVLTAVGLAVGLSAIPTARAQTKAGGGTIFRPQPKETTPPKKADDGREVLREIGDPETVDEYWRAVDYEINFGKPDKARRYIRALLSHKDATVEKLLDLRDKYGSAMLIQMSVRPELGIPAQELLTKINTAAVARLRDPERLKRFIGNLEKSESERTFALDQLRQAGVYAVPPLVEALTSGMGNADAQSAALAALPAECWEPVDALLASDNPTLLTAAARALARYNAKGSEEALWYAAAAPKMPPAGKQAALAGLARSLGGAVEAAEAPGQLARIADSYFFRRAPRDFGTEQYPVWTFKDNKLTVAPVPSAVAERQFGLAVAEHALQIDPASRAAIRSKLSLLLDAGRNVELPADAKALATTAALADLLERARNERRPNLGGNVVRLLGEDKSPDSFARLAQALDFPDKRVQFAAAEAVLARKPAARFEGAQRIVPILLRATTIGEGRTAVLGDGNVGRANQTAAVLSKMGYNVQSVRSGRDVFRAAAAAGDVELLVVEPTLQNPPVLDLLSQLATDARTSGIPTVVFGIEPPDFTPPEILRPLTPSEREAIERKQRHQAQLEEMRPDMFAYAVRVPEREKRVYTSTERVEYLLNRLGFAADPAERQKLMTLAPDMVPVSQPPLVDRGTVVKLKQWFDSEIDKLDHYRAQHPNVVTSPHFDKPELFARYLRLTMGEIGGEPQASDENKRIREAAYDRLVQIAKGDFPYLRADEALPALGGALALSSDGARAAEALGYLPSAYAQARLAEQASAGLQKEAVRLAAAKALVENLKRGGRLLPIAQTEALLRATALEAPGPMADALSEVVTTLGPTAKAKLEAMKKKLGPPPARKAPAVKRPADSTPDDTPAPTTKGAKRKAASDDDL